MVRATAVMLGLLMVLSLNRCMLSKSIILDNSPPAIVWDEGFETGLVFKAPRQSSLLTWQGPQVTIREFLTREIVFKEEVKWHTLTSITLNPGKYIVDCYVPYLGFRIWSYKGFFEVSETAPSHLIYKTPYLITSDPQVILR